MSNRCPKCGSITHHAITDLLGNTFRRCTTGLTMYREHGSQAHWIDPCGTIIDNRGAPVGYGEDGEPATQHLIYRTYDSKGKAQLKDLMVRGGKQVE